MLKDSYAACLAVLMMAPALLMPVDSFAQSYESFGMLLLHDDVAGAFNPETSQEPELPLARDTVQDTYRVELTWEPVEIKANKMVSFDLRIIDLRTNNPAENVYYDFAVVKDDEPVKELRGSFALKGMATHTVEFPSSGSFRVIVNVLGSGEISNQRGEVASFDLRVVPEFPAGMLIVTATLVAITIALTRFTVLNKRAGRSDAP